jgi:hypothetical protein
MAYTLATSTTTNDLYIDPLSGNIATFRDLPAVLQACEHAAKTILGEMILNADQGIPYFQTVWNGSPNLVQFEAALRAAFLAVTNVVEVVSVISSVTTPNILSYTAIIRTTFGGGTISG